MSLVAFDEALVDGGAQYQLSEWFARYSRCSVDGGTYFGYDPRVLVCADARHGFRSQPGSIQQQAHGLFDNSAFAAGNGLTGPNIGGSTVRIARIVDPDDAGSFAWHFRCDSGDADTGTSGKRSEFGYLGRRLLEGTRYTIGFSVRLEDWRALEDEQLVVQIHQDDDLQPGSPWFGLYVIDGALQVQLRYAVDGEYANGVTRLTPWTAGTNWQPETWMRFVLDVREDWTGGGIARLLLGGEELFDYRGPLGFNEGASSSYLKTGYYHWTNAGNTWDGTLSIRQCWHKGAYITTSGAGVAEMDSFLATL